MARKGLQRKVQLALGLLVVAVAASATIPFGAQRRVDAALADASRAEAGIASVLRLSIAVRDDYAHQAHTVILNDTSHLDHYNDMAKVMMAALAAAQTAVKGTRAEGPLARVARDASLLDASFRNDVLPRVGGDRSELIEPAEEAIHHVERMQLDVDRAAALLAEDAAVAKSALHAAMEQSRLASGIVFVLAALVAVVSGVVLNRSLSRPLGRLEAATDALAGGDLTTRVAPEIVGRDDELGSLASRFNEMAERLAEREARLLESERLASVGRLAAGVAHEINNPLGVILGHARLLERRLDDDGKKDVRTIVAEVERCRLIVASLLDLARPPRLRLGPVDLEELVRETSERLGPSGVSGVELSARGDTNIEADGEKLRQIVDNLLLNAAQAGAVHIGVEIDAASPETVRIVVRDDGCGVLPEIVDRLFAPFSTTKAEGTGLGLAVSRAIAVAHGGQLLFVPNAGSERKGARFDVVLPRRASREAA